MLNLSVKLALLDEIYRIYGEFSNHQDAACCKTCSTCCTRNVTLTSLEGAHIVNYLNENNRIDLGERVFEQRHESRFCPEVTLNGLAERFARGEEAPEEGYPLEGKCPLLEKDLCAIYPARPFGCRCFQSKQNCRETGFAEVEPFVLSVNHLFLQFIEQVDAGGIFGNLTDMVIFLGSDENLKDYENHALQEPLVPFIRNRPISGLLIPPEHQDRIRGILSELQGIRLPTA